MRKKTKIVCTIGPASQDRQTLRSMIEAGLDVARLNFSHGQHAEHALGYEAVRGAASDEGREVAVLLDIQGPKIRTGQGPVVCLADGQSLHVGPPGVGRDLVIDYPYLAEDLHSGSSVFLCDGLVELTVEGIEGEAIRCRVARGGEVGSRKGVTLPGVAVSYRPLRPRMSRTSSLAPPWAST